VEFEWVGRFRDDIRIVVKKAKEELIVEEVDSINSIYGNVLKSSQ